ncbi:MAG: histidinol-phosphate aminotransferase family protein [Opitutales bacterium]|nr:histidinol-phosphate aminotransferase family protein [Opitutales bacterium]
MPEKTSTPALPHLPNISRRTALRSLGLFAGSGLLGLGTARAQDATGSTPLVDTSAQARYPELSFINLAGNENPFGPSRRVTMTLMREAANSSRYPFRETNILRDEIAAAEGVPPDHILIGNGGDEVLGFLGVEYGKPGVEIVATQPTYLQLMDHAERRGAKIRWVAATKPAMQHDLAAMKAAVNDHTALVYICNPDTPSGTMRTPAEIEAFCREVAPRVPVVLDEVYLDLLDDFSEQTQVGLVREGLSVLICRSFSKLHALAGHRIGYLIGPPSILQRLERHRLSGLNFLGVACARESLRDTAFHLFSRRSIRDGRAALGALLDELGLPYIPSFGNFIFHSTGTPIREFQDYMRDRRLFVGRPFPPYDEWVRISIGLPQEMRVYERALREWHASQQT